MGLPTPAIERGKRKCVFRYVVESVGVTRLPLVKLGPVQDSMVHIQSSVVVVNNRTRLITILILELLL
jgi:hypothetical protein